MTRSEQYKCGGCGGAIDVEVEHDTDERYGDRIRIDVSCDNCGDSRVGELHEEQMGTEMTRLAAVLGSAR